MSNPGRFDDLLSRHLDEALEASEQAALCAWLMLPEYSARFLEMTKLNAEIAGLLAAPVPDEVMAGLVLSDIKNGEAGVVHPMPASVTARLPRRVSKAPWSGALKWAAVFVALLAGAAVYFSGIWRTLPHRGVVAGKEEGNSKNPTPLPVEEKLPEVAAVQGEVYFIDASGQAQLTGKQPLNKTGKLKTVGKESRASILLGDGTRVDLGGDSVLVTETAPDKPRFYLEVGSLDSRIPSQPAEKPLTFGTPELEAVVKGTALSLAAWPHYTRLVVTEGTVLLKRREDGAEVTVHAGYHVLVAPHSKLVADPNHPAPKRR